MGEAATEVRIAQAKARCRCGSERFIAPAQRARDLDARYVCAGCGVETTFGALLDGIGEEAMRQSRISLRRLKDRRPSR